MSKTLPVRLELVEEKRAERQKLGPTFVYLGVKPIVRRKQIRERSAFLEENRRARPTSRQIIATLLELISDPRSTRDEIVRRCQRTGVVISLKVVDSIFAAYDLDKKRAP